jgi:hypothetical protein
MYSLALIIFVVSEKKAKIFQNASSLKPLGQLKQNCPIMIIEQFSTKLRFFMPIGKPRWPPLQDIRLTLDPMGKMFQNASSLKPLISYREKRPKRCREPSNEHSCTV